MHVPILRGHISLSLASVASAWSPYKGDSHSRADPAPQARVTLSFTLLPLAGLREPSSQMEEAVPHARLMDVVLNSPRKNSLRVSVLASQGASRD